YLREPATDGSSIVFSSRGRLFAMDSLEATPREVEVLVSGVGAARVPRPASPSENLLAMRPLHDARASVVEWRGSVHALTHRGGPSRLLAGTCGLRLREARPLGRTPFALFVSDAEALADREAGGVGSDVLALARLDGGGEEIRLDVGPIGRILHAIPSPPAPWGAWCPSAGSRTPRRSPSTHRPPTPPPPPGSRTPSTPSPRHAWTTCARWAAPAAARCGTWPGPRTGGGWCGPSRTPG